MFWKTVGRWILAAVAIPLAAAGARKLSQRVEAKRGGTRTARVVRGGADMLTKMSGRRSKRRLGW